MATNKESRTITEQIFADIQIYPFINSAFSIIGNESLFGIICDTDTIPLTHKQLYIRQIII
jgi:hypothetical protein